MGDHGHKKLLQGLHEHVIGSNTTKYRGESVGSPALVVEFANQSQHHNCPLSSSCLKVMRTHLQGRPSRERAPLHAHYDGKMIYFPLERPTSGQKETGERAKLNVISTIPSRYLRKKVGPRTVLHEYNYFRLLDIRS